MMLETILFLDFETSSGDKNKPSFDPYDVEHCKPIVLGYAWGDGPIQSVWMPTKEFVQSLLRKATHLVAHNLQYDIAVLRCYYGLDFLGELIDTLVMANLHNSDLRYRGGYGLKNLAKLMGYHDPYDEVIKEYLESIGSKDYGDVPQPILEKYCKQDIHITRKVYHRTLPSCRKVQSLWNTEKKVTRVLCDATHRGMKINKKTLLVERFRTQAQIRKHLERIEEIVKDLNPEYLKGGIDPQSPKQMENLIIKNLGYEAKERTEKGNPSFSHSAMVDYETSCASEHKELFQRLGECRREGTMLGLFWEPWSLLEQDGVLHPKFNQNVSSGRMSCSDPNAQQLNPRAKAVIEPREGKKFVSLDYEQVEYRVMVSILGNKAAIKAYNENPDVDFHIWVAERCEIDRKPAKNVNFAIGFGAGERKIVRMLTDLGQGQNAKRIFDDYHANLPELRPMSKELELDCKCDGYVTNRFGRRLHLSPSHAYKAFNRRVQSTAADIMKNRVAELVNFPIICLVHDDVVLEVDIDDNETGPEAKRIMEDINYPVPITTSYSESERNWSEC